MEFNEYQKQAETTAKDSIKDDLSYFILEMCGEAGEIANKYKKVIRDGGEIDRKDFAKELGDVLWPLSQAARVIGYELDEVASINLDKLFSRQARGVISGSGDNR